MRCAVAQSNHHFRLSQAHRVFSVIPNMFQSVFVCIQYQFVVTLKLLVYIFILCSLLRGIYSIITNKVMRVRRLI